MTAQKKPRYLITRTLTAAAVALTLLFVSACGGGSGTTSGSREAGTSAPSPGNTGTGNAANGGQGSSSHAPEASKSAARTFKHEFGEIQVPANPQRITALYMEDYLVALGIKPVTQTVIGSFFLKYLQPHIGTLPKLDTSAISFEAALGAQPDLILLAFPSYANGGKYEQFSKIAPTYVFGDDAPDKWRDALLTVGELTGKKAEAQKVLDDYAKKTADAKQKLKAALGDETVALLRVRSNKEVRLYGGPGGYAGNVLYTDLGLNVPEVVKKYAWGENSMKVVSLEVIPELQVDHLFITYDEGGKELAQEIFDSNVWKALPAVKNGKTYEVSLDHWMTFGPVAYNLKVDDVVKALVK